jgi:tRNA pseudouridine55 synthase
VNGILLIDKPRGISSNQALGEIKRLYGTKKAGHTGSLDPLACGMLPICLGEATKFSQFLLEADKEYTVEARLGICTTTGDAEGQIVATKDVNVSLSQLQEVLHAFKGKIEQVPSMYSAIKFKGKPLYAYARRGISIDRQSRTVHIKKIDLIHFSKEIFSLNIHCSKGTYIRTLIEDIGEKIGCGAYVTSLRRTLVVPYMDAMMVTLAELKEAKKAGLPLDKWLLPIESALDSYPEVKLAPSSAFYIKQGQAVIVPKAPTQGWVKLFSQEGMFMGVGEILEDGKIAPRRLIKQ